jgi:hypothetical protein
VPGTSQVLAAVLWIWVWWTNRLHRKAIEEENIRITVEWIEEMRDLPDGDHLERNKFVSLMKGKS